MAEKIIIASGKGGSGKTTCCTGIAKDLAQKGLSVLVVDCDIAQGCIEFMLGSAQESVYNWGDVISGACKISDALMSADGVDYLTPPNKWSDCFTTAAFNKMINSVESSYSYIFFDSPAGLLGGFLLAAYSADKAIIVSTPDEVCVKAAGRASRELASSGVEDCRLIINRFDREPVKKGKFLNVDEVIDGVCAQLIGVVPEDKKIKETAETGYSFIKDCPAKAAYERIALRLTGATVYLDLSNKKNNKKRHPALKRFFVTVICLLFAVVIALGGLFFTDFYLTRNLREPIFEIKPYTVKVDDETTKYTGVFYNCYVVRDGKKIVSTKMTVGPYTVAGAVE